jgi:hypothetical protein
MIYILIYIFVLKLYIALLPLVELSSTRGKSAMYNFKEEKCGEAAQTLKNYSTVMGD